MKACTIMGMGRSATGEIEGVGEIWGLNNGYNRFPGLKFDRFYEIHETEYARRHIPNQQKHDHFTRLDLLGCPVYMQSSVPEVRESRPYPLEAICCHFGTNYFLGSPSYMLAHALYEGYQHIRVFGFDQNDAQHAQQRQSWTFWLGKAQTMGIKIDGTHNWLGEWDIDALGCMNGWRASAIPTMQKAVDDGKINRRTVFISCPVAPQQEPPPKQLVVTEKQET